VSQSNLTKQDLLAHPVVQFVKQQWGGLLFWPTLYISNIIKMILGSSGPCDRNLVIHITLSFGFCSFVLLYKPC